MTRVVLDQVAAHFRDNALPHFGPYQDAMCVGEPVLYHSRLSAALNLKLLGPREVVDAATHRFAAGLAPSAPVEGFVRQILGWREYVRALYWQHMPQWRQWNAPQAGKALPPVLLAWRGGHGLSDAIGQTLRLGYAHHIQRLMVTGLFALLYGVEPLAVHRWCLAVYVDAVE